MPNNEAFTPEELRQMDRELEEYYKFIEGLRHPPTLFEWKKYYR